MNRIRDWLTAAAILGAICSTALGLDQQGEPTSALRAPVLPEFVLAYPRGAHGHEDYAGSVRQEVARLGVEADRAVEPASRADLQIAAANALLARSIEPAFTWKLLGVEGRAGDESLRDLLAEVDGYLGKAEATLELTRDSGGRNEKRTAEAAKKLMVLRAFAGAARNYLLFEEGAQVPAEARRRAAGLSILLEDEDLDIAAAASLWQACLRSLRSDATRALTLLDDVLERPSSATLRYSFFARILRCRLIADGGGHAAALALLLQMEERLTEWFLDENDRGDAFRAIGAVQIRILTDWRARLADDQVAARRWCVARLEALSGERFTEHKTVLRLETAVPILGPRKGG